MALFINLKPKLVDEVDKGRKEKGIWDKFSAAKSTLSTINILFYVILIFVSILQLFTVFILHWRVVYLYSYIQIKYIWL